MQSIALAALIVGSGALKIPQQGDLTKLRGHSQNATHNASDLTVGAEETLKGNWCGYGTTGKWQGSQVNESCTTKFEKQYLLDHQEELKEGLEALRKPGCVKPGNKVATGGIFRSGSTLLFNQVRLWMNLAFPNNVSTGFDPDPEHFHFAKAHGAVVAKAHKLHDWLARESDHLLMSRRSVVDSVITRISFLNGTRPVHLTGSPKDEADLLKAVGDDCKNLMCQQREAYSAWEKTGRTVDYDVLLSDYFADPAREIQKIAESSGVCKQAAENKALQAFVEAMGKDLMHMDLLSPDARLTQMHEPSKEVDKAKLRPSIQRHVDSIPKCHAWSAADADPSKSKD
mmetsp:Transcript_19630/g.55193  ORF Transcript_19630/g.55193 Transcript_19630/m.55193 type:complete len:342 (+) Transcript_19630:79-1104(+)